MTRDTRWPRVVARAFLFFSLVTVVASGKQENLKICVVGNPDVKTTHATKYCDLLGKSKRTPVSCVYEPDRLGCLWAVSKRKADFSVFDPEDLYFSTLLDQSLVLVVGEIKDLKKKRYHDGSVVVVRKSSNISSIKDLMGKKLCHPGMESGSEWPYLFAQYFEERVAPANCEEGITVYEDRIRTTSNFFGSACKAGPWVVNPEEDARLKKQYWNLCALCDSGDCRVEEKYRGSGGSLTCFKDHVGDVLWAKYEEVKIHLASKENAATEYSYLCDDGQVMAIDVEEPCVWLAKPWQVVAANGKSATSVQKILEGLGREQHTEWEENLLHLIELYLQYVQNLPVLRTPEDYLRGIPGYLSASAMAEGNCKPKHSVKLCVSSAMEHLKCVWTSKAAAALAVRPVLNCIQKPNFTACLDSVKRMETDVIVVPPDYLFDAILKYNLKTFLMESGDHFNDSYLVAAAVKKNSNIKKVSDLRGKRACFTRTNGIGWNAAVTVLQEDNLIDSECEDHEGLSDFFGEICVVENDGSGLASCCSDVKSGTDEEKALACLEKSGCDVAFLDVNSLQESEDEKGMKKYSEDELRTICRNQEKPADCQWSWSDPSFLMMHSEVNSTKAEEAYSVFYQLGQYFGRNSRKNNAMLKIFGPFNEASNVLFRDSSTSFVPLDRWNESHYYGQTMKKLRLCSGSHRIATTFLPFLSFIVLLIKQD